MYEEDLDFMEQINQELELDTSVESQPEGLIKRSAKLFLLLHYDLPVRCNTLAVFVKL